MEGIYEKGFKEFLEEGISSEKREKHNCPILWTIIQKNGQDN